MTRKVALIELGIVTAGVLIALSFDGVRGWMDHRSLATEARATLLAEIRENKKELDGILENIGRHQDNYRQAYTAAQNLIAGKPLGTNEINIGFGVAQLSAAAYATAEVTGAFSYMEYEDVRRFAGVYDLQAKYDALQDQGLTHVATVSGPLLLADDPSGVSRAELEEWKRQLQAAIGALDLQRQMAVRLSGSYAEILEGRKTP